MIKLTTIFKINKTIDAVIEIVKNIGTVTEYTLVPTNEVEIVDNKIMIKEKTFEAKKDFFRKVRSI